MKNSQLSYLFCKDIRTYSNRSIQIIQETFAVSFGTCKIICPSTE
jgi:hypothetical protein